MNKQQLNTNLRLQYEGVLGEIKYYEGLQSTAEVEDTLSNLRHRASELLERIKETD